MSSRSVLEQLKATLLPCQSLAFESYYDDGGLSHVFVLLAFGPTSLRIFDLRCDDCVKMLNAWTSSTRRARSRSRNHHRCRFRTFRPWAHRLSTLCSCGLVTTIWASTRLGCR